ncbi:MAG: TetR family transcriptional regulator [Microbacteriaceae bacterium]|nr:TetR family transcriptional regulator [Microbacteriaceae bacterium]
MSPERRRAELVALGVAMLANEPLEALTIESLSERAGVSRGLVIHYFGTRQGLHREVVLTARDSMLRASEPQPELAPLDRLHDTLTRIVQFVRDHRETFFSLVRGAASGDRQVRDGVEQARSLQADHLIAVFHELGLPDSDLLSIALRSWVAFAEETLVEIAINTDMPSAEIVAFLERSVKAVAASVDANLPGPFAG